MDNYVSVVVGKQMFKKKAQVSLLSSFVTVSDEAFALLTVKNNQEVWPVKYRNKGKRHEDMEKVPDTKYTNRRRYGKVRDGWTKEGQREFLRYYNMVMDDRRSPSGVEMERELLLLYKSEGSGKNLTMENEEDDDGDIVDIPTDWGYEMTEQEEDRNPGGDISGVGQIEQI